MLQSLLTRFAAAVIIALVAAACVPALMASVGEDVPALVEDEDPETGPMREADHDPEARGEEPPAVTDLDGHEIDLDEPRPWLRSVSTAPMRPRVGRHLPSASPHRGLQPRNPRIRIDNPSVGLDAVRDTPGVAFATTVFVDEVLVRHDGDRQRLDVAFVHPGGFRVFTPALSAEAEPLWRALGEDEVVVTHEAARRFGIRAGDDISLGPLLRRTDARVAGALSLGRASIADVVLHTDARERLGRDARRAILVGVERLGEIDTVIDRLEAAGAGEVARVADIEPYRAELVGDDADTAAAFEPFTFEQTDGGRIQIDPGWVERHIVEADLPILGTAKCHRLILPQLLAALEEIIERELDDLLDPGDFGGCWMPRHIGWDHSRALSMHAWGVAFDVNVHTNLMGDEPEIDARLVEVFERHGFSWGGRWRTPDGMHFELGELLDP